MSPRPRYAHTQIGWATLIAAVLGAVIGLVALHLTPGSAAPDWMAWLIVALMLATALGFGSLNVCVNRDSLQWRFGLGWPRKSLALSEIAAAAPTRTRFIEGWGIHLTRRGWLYNVSGFDAVLITRHDGKTLMIGSDEPRALAAAIERARAGR